MKRRNYIQVTDRGPAHITKQRVNQPGVFVTLCGAHAWGPATKEPQAHVCSRCKRIARIQERGR